MYTLMQIQIQPREMVVRHRDGKKWSPINGFLPAAESASRCEANVNPFILQCHPDGDPKHG